MYCKECGAKLEEDARFCPKCGKKIDRQNRNTEREKVKSHSKSKNYPNAFPDKENTNLLDWESDFTVPDNDVSPNRRKWLLSIVISAVILAFTGVVLCVLLSRNTPHDDSGIVVNPVKNEGTSSTSTHIGQNSTASTLMPTTIEPTGEPEPNGTSLPTITPKPTMTPKSTATPKSSITPKPTATPKPTMTPKATMTSKPTVTQEYVFAESDSSYLTESQLQSLTREQLLYARNEIYARRGRKFRDQTIQDYFNSKSWYVASYEPDEFDAISNKVFNAYEKANIELILAVEKSKGYTY